MNKVTFIKTDNLNTDLDYKKALEEFVSLVNCDDLDARILANPRVADFFNEKIDLAWKKHFWEMMETILHIFLFKDVCTISTD